jgi:hypothetical protein
LPNLPLVNLSAVSYAFSILEILRWLFRLHISYFSFHVYYLIQCAYSFLKHTFIIYIKVSIYSTVNNTFKKISFYFQERYWSYTTDFFGIATVIASFHLEGTIQHSKHLLKIPTNISISLSSNSFMPRMWFLAILGLYYWVPF